MEGPLPMLFSFITDTEEVRVGFLAVSFAVIYGQMSLNSVNFSSIRRHIFLFLLCCSPLWFTMNALLLTFLAGLPLLSTVLAW